MIDEVRPSRVENERRKTEWKERKVTNAHLDSDSTVKAIRDSEQFVRRRVTLSFSVRTNSRLERSSTAIFFPGLDFTRTSIQTSPIDEQLQLLMTFLRAICGPPDA